MTRAAETLHQDEVTDRDWLRHNEKSATTHQLHTHNFNKSILEGLSSNQSELFYLFDLVPLSFLIAEDLTATESLLTSSADGQPVITAGLPAGVSEQDWVSMLIGSPIFDSVNEIENMLKNNFGEGGVAGAKGGRPYIDIKDAQWLCRGDLVPVDINDLSPANFVVYRFGVFITQMLRKAMEAPEVTLLLASNLPQNNYERNAFRNSFFYEHARRVLFVRQERMESVGDFLVVIMHCLAHIKIEDLVDDQNPLFLREFYKVLLRSSDSAVRKCDWVLTQPKKSNMHNLLFLYSHTVTEYNTSMIEFKMIGTLSDLVWNLLRKHMINIWYLFIQSPPITMLTLKKGIRIPPGILQGAKVLVKATSRDDLPNKPQLTTCQL